MRRRWRDLAFEKKLSIVVMPIVLAVLSGFLLPMLLRDDGGGGGGGADPSPAPKASLSVPEVVVSNPVREFRELDPATGASEQTKSSLPAVELTLHNVGTRRSIVRRARFTIRRHVHLPICATAGDLPLGRTYGVALPADPAPGTVVESTPLRRQLAADEAEVLRFRFTVDEREPSGDHLYEIAISILHDASSQPQAAGTVLLSLPGSPDEEQVLDAAEQADRETLLASFPPEVVECWERNTERLLAFLRARGARSPELESMARRYGAGA